MLLAGSACSYSSRPPPQSPGHRGRLRPREGIGAAGATQQVQQVLGPTHLSSKLPDVVPKAIGVMDFASCCQGELWTGVPPRNHLDAQLGHVRVSGVPRHQGSICSTCTVSMAPTPGVTLMELGRGPFLALSLSHVPWELQALPLSLCGSTGHGSFFTHLHGDAMPADHQGLPSLAWHSA